MTRHHFSATSNDTVCQLGQAWSPTVDTVAVSFTMVPAGTDAAAWKVALSVMDPPATIPNNESCGALVVTPG